MNASELELEAQISAIARELAADGGGDDQARVFHLGWWSERMLAWAMAHPQFKTQLFRFVDVFPACADDAEVLRHLEEYFDGVPVPGALELGLDLAEHVPLGRVLSATTARRNITRMARQFIADGRLACKWLGREVADHGNSGRIYRRASDGAAHALFGALH